MDRVSQFIEATPRLDREHLLPTVISIAAATTLLYSSYRLITNKKTDTKQAVKEIPVPGSCYPYVGHMMSLGELPGQTLTKWHKELGPIMKLKMGRQTWITVDDPVLAHKIFVTRGSETSYRPHSYFCYELFSKKGKGLTFSQPGGEWKKNRSAVLAVLAPNKIENYMEDIIRESGDLVNRLMAVTEQEGSVYPLKHLELNSMNIVFKAGIGRRFDSVDNSEFHQVSNLVQRAMKFAGTEDDMANFLPVFSMLDYFSGIQLKMRKFMDDEYTPKFRSMVREAEASRENNIVKSILEEGFEMTEEEKICFMSDMIGAGTDTVSTTLLWLFALMCHHPDTQTRVCAEIDAFIRAQGRIPYFKDRLELPFCVSVIKESMRMRPTTSFGLPHCIHEDVEVDGYILPKDSVIICNMDSIHKNVERYPDPLTFIPDRFMNNLKTMQSAANGKLEERDHFNFGWGRRMCPAVYMAEVEMFMAFIQVFSKCRIEPETESQLPNIVDVTNGGLTNLPNPYKVKFTKRTDALV